MSNEILFFAVTIIDILFVYLAYRLGREWLVGTVIINLVLISTLGAKVISLFGFVTNIGNPLYACVFLATQLYIERYDKKKSYRLIWSGFTLVVFFTILSQLTLLYQGLPQSALLDESARSLFAFAPRIMVASLLAYIVSSYTNVLVYSKIKERINKKSLLWLSSVGANSSGQFIDSCLFFTTAFFGILPTPTLLSAMILGWGVKVLVGVFTIPFLYHAHFFKPHQQLEGGGMTK